MAALVTPALAQDPSLTPISGTIQLDSGFVPDPHTAQVLAGGDQDSSATLAGTGCVGLVSGAPDYRVNYTSGALPLHIFANSGQDVSLLVNTPSGNWVCDDDSGPGLNPAVSFTQPESGQYDIWVGKIDPNGGFAETTLSISEVQTGRDDGGSGGGGGEFDLSAAPTYGTLNLAAGFEPDPQTVNVTSGGPVNASSLGNGCIGWGARAPDVRLNYSPDGRKLAILVVSDAGDTALAINQPDGTWICDDDSAGELDPIVVLTNPQSGQYDIYVTSVTGQSEGFEAVVAVSELVD